MSLFPSQSFGGARGSQPLVQFKAGIMEVHERPNNKFLVSPDPKKGQVSLIKGNDDLIHFHWSDRTLNSTVHDFILLADTAVFKKVNTGKQGDRVYLLQWKGQSRRFFFWMQDKNSSKDEENCAKINEYINNPPQDQVPQGQEALMQMLGLGGIAPRAAAPAPSRESNPASTNTSVSAPAASTAGASAAAGGLQLSQLQNILAGLGLPPAPESSTPANPNPGATTVAPPSTVHQASVGQGITSTDLQRALMGAVAGMSSRISLNHVLDPTNEDVGRSGLLDVPEVREELMGLLPEEQRDEANLRETLHSPQFQQALRALTAALHTDNFNSIMTNLGLELPTDASAMDALARGDNVLAFLEALMASVQAEQDQQPEPMREDENSS